MDKEFYKEVFQVVWNFIFIVTVVAFCFSSVVVIISVAFKYIIKPVWVWGGLH